MTSPTRYDVILTNVGAPFRRPCYCSIIPDFIESLAAVQKCAAVFCIIPAYYGIITPGDEVEHCNDKGSDTVYPYNIRGTAYGKATAR